jgi:alkylhydroperoxidase family enzyme
MTRIPLIEPDQAPADVQDVYARLGGERASVLNVMKVFAHDPPFLDGFANMIQALYGDDVIEPRHRELAWLRTSQVNDCHY